ncbi:hypothetical protein [Azonexus hydrophilus]|uniref:Uncharacterized protein n=1 Tax=Azonexus hydrophilus TaxID=418702 RepID=A0ABZ2XMY4_9RHOO
MHLTKQQIEAIKRCLAMAEAHVEDINSGLEEGLYTEEDNQDIGEKEASVQVVQDFLESIGEGEDRPTKQYTGILEVDGLLIEQRITAPHNASVPELDRAFMAKLAQVASISYVEVAPAA